MHLERSAEDSQPEGDRRLGQVAAPTGVVSELFCSIQGEGLYLGERQMFLRTAGCSATCYWCDTVSSKKERSNCLVHAANKRSLPNPLTVEKVVGESLALIKEQGGVRTVSITGGEPLEQGDFVTAVSKLLKRSGYRIYLETNGLEIEGLRSVRPHVDAVAMDIKLPHATGKRHWDVHQEFLSYLTCRDVFVKVVVDHTTPLEEILRAVELVADIDRNIPLVLQPESSTLLKAAGGREARASLLDLLVEAQRVATSRLDDVRVIPQCHKVLKVR